MSATIAGLLGAVIGALAVVASTFVTYSLQAKQEHRKWLRNKRQEAYANSVRYILRVLNKRSELSIEGGAFLGKDAQKEWFDDMSEALTWITTLAMYCPNTQQKQILDVLREIQDTVSGIVNGHKGGSFRQLTAFDNAYKVILASAISDIETTE